MSDVYYRLYVDRTNTACVVCMQDFDECDYDQHRFLSSKKFDSEEQAWEYLSVNSDKVPSWVTVPQTAHNCLDL